MSFHVVKHAPVILFPQEKMLVLSSIEHLPQPAFLWNDFFRLPVAINTYTSWWVGHSTSCKTSVLPKNTKMLIVSKESTLLILSLSKPLIRPQDFLLCSKHQLSELTVAVSVPFIMWLSRKDWELLNSQIWLPFNQAAVKFCLPWASHYFFFFLFSEFGRQLAWDWKVTCPAENLLLSISRMAEWHFFF